MYTDTLGKFWQAHGNVEVWFLPLFTMWEKEFLKETIAGDFCEAALMFN